MYIDKILWLLAWPVLITVSYYLIVVVLKKLKKQIEEDPLGKDLRP